ncbi:MAG: GGDEF domain-containing protein, partial [Rhodospirillaceae bacterium]
MAQTDAKTIENLKAEVSRLKELLRISDDSLKASQDEVLRLSTIDPLTGVSNRRHFMDLADQEISRARRYRRPLAVISIAVDNFKAVNEIHGSEAGDRVLAAMGDAARKTLRTIDVIGRTAGTELTVLLPETEQDGTEILAQRLCDDLSESAAATLTGEPIPTMSVGATHFVREDVIFDTTIQRADQAMEEAHDAGGNRMIYKPAFD